MALNLSKLPWYAQIGAFVAVAAGGFGAFYYTYEMPAQADLKTRRAQLETLRAEIAKGQSVAQKLPQFRAQVAELEGRLDTLRIVLPDEKDAADLLRRMQTVAAESSLVIKDFKPLPTVTRDLHAEWPITLQLEGTYHNLATFFDKVGKFTRIVNITGVDVKAKDRPDASTTITAVCTATTFVLLDKPATPPAAGRGAPPRKAA